MNANKRLLITGANGFIGGRVLERAFMQGRWQVRAGVHTWSGAARVGRLGCDVRPCDLLNPDQVVYALQDVSAIIHCALGSRDVMLAGTRNLLDAALRLGVERFVHISTCDVYGANEGTVSESNALQASGRGYAGSKREVEDLIWEYAKKGLGVTVLRPTIVYGPFSKPWSIRYATRILAHRWGTLGKGGEGVCNLVYVDDVAMAALRAVEHPDAVGQAFNITGNDDITWNGYWEKLTSAMDQPPLKQLNSQWIYTKASFLTPLRVTAQFALKRFRARIMRIYSQNYAARGMMQATEGALSMTPTLDELALYRRRARYSNNKAKNVMGFVPRVSLSEGLAYTVAWLRHHDYLMDDREQPA